MAKKKGPVLYELLRKDPAEKRSVQPQQDGPLPEAPAADKPQETPVVEPAPLPPASRMDAPDGDGMVFHLTRTQAAVAAGSVMMALVVFAWIGCRAGKPMQPDGLQQTAGQTVGKTAAAADSEPQQPLEMLLPEPGSDPKPDLPVKVSPAVAEAASSAKPGDDAEPAGDTGPGATAGTSLVKGDSRKAGLNYLVIQIIPDRPDAQEHAAEVRKFLATKKIRTIEVPGTNGGIKILGEQGFNFDEPNDKARLEQLTEAVKRAGKEYATARYAGRYDFRAPYPEKYKGR